jgi:hypothetical protein
LEFGFLARRYALGQRLERLAARVPGREGQESALSEPVAHRFGKPFEFGLDHFVGEREL